MIWKAADISTIQIGITGRESHLQIINKNLLGILLTYTFSTSLCNLFQTNALSLCQ